MSVKYGNLGSGDNPSCYADTYRSTALRLQQSLGVLLGLAFYSLPFGLPGTVRNLAKPSHGFIEISSKSKNGFLMTSSIEI